MERQNCPYIRNGFSYWRDGSLKI